MADVFIVMGRSYLQGRELLYRTLPGIAFEIIPFGAKR
jgi:hypothetical protein